MRFKTGQKILDIIRGKVFNGQNNKIILFNGKEIDISRQFAYSKFKISGNNNRIVLRGNYTKDCYSNLLQELKIIITGNNNLIDIEFPLKFDDVLIDIDNDNNIFKIKQTKYTVRKAIFFIEDGSTVLIGTNSELRNRNLHLVANQGYKNKPKIIIGNNVHIAKDVIIRASDGHCLIDSVTKKPINEPKDVIIGDNVWIASRVTILKGSQISDNSVVGACSLVNKKFTEKNVIIAGSPAKIIRRNIEWDDSSYREIMERIENENSKK